MWTRRRGGRGKGAGLAEKERRREREGRGRGERAVLEMNDSLARPLLVESEEKRILLFSRH